jgi:uncharacterized membrane protein
MADVTVPPKHRYVFIDLYRTAVVLLMLEGHVFRALLAVPYQQTEWFRIHELFHGISAPAFLFGAGLTFIVSTRKQWHDFHHWGPPLNHRVKRLLLILLLGLALHLPFFSFKKIIMEGTTQDYLQLFQSDVLACIGLGLLSLHGLLFFFKKDTHFYFLVFLATILISLSTPLIWDIDFLKIFPPALAQLLNSNYGSPFPLFPFVGFLFAGVIVSWEFVVAVEKQREQQFMTYLCFSGIGALIGGILLDLLPVRVYPTYNFWYTSPNYFLIRTGALMLLVSTMWFITTTIKLRNPIFTVLGRESLFVYVLHLLVVYGSVINPQQNLSSMLGQSLTPLPAIGLTVGSIAAMTGLAFGWNLLKEKKMLALRIVQTSGAMWFLYTFFTNEY